MARHTWLALVDHLRDFADRQLNAFEQRQDAQPGRIGKRPENVENRGHGSHIKNSLYPRQSAPSALLDYADRAKQLYRDRIHV